MTPREHAKEALPKLRGRWKAREYYLWCNNVTAVPYVKARINLVPSEFLKEVTRMLNDNYRLRLSRERDNPNVF